jgi:NADH-quinone oxidoreductase subunit K
MLYPDGHEGYFFAIFGIAIAAAESAIAIAIMINIYRMLKNISVDELKKLKW